MKTYAFTTINTFIKYIRKILLSSFRLTVFIFYDMLLMDLLMFQAEKSKVSRG
jgi:hypothetical protein